jgi:hypothetical protein
MAGATITDKDIADVKADVNKDYAASNNMYDKAISDVDNKIGEMQSSVKDWEKTQTDLQNEQTDFTIQTINQEKDQAKSDYIKEQSGAYKDWQKQSNAYGANAEAMAAQGMANSGYSESSQVSMYNTYQNRVATARESYNRAVLNYNNAITQAQLQNSSALAEIAYESMSKQLELSLTGLQYRNTLISEKASAARAIKSDSWSRYMDLLSQINTQKAYQLELGKWNYTKEQDQKSNSGTDNLVSSKGGGRTPDTSRVKFAAPKKLDTLKNVSKTTKSTKSPTVDMNSVLGLGYGPISAKKLNQLVKEGKVKESVKNGKLVYKKAFNY